MQVVGHQIQDQVICTMEIVALVCCESNRGPQFTDWQILSGMLYRALAAKWQWKSVLARMHRNHFLIRMVGRVNCTYVGTVQVL